MKFRVNLLIKNISKSGLNNTHGMIHTSIVYTWKAATRASAIYMTTISTVGVDPWVSVFNGGFARNGLCKQMKLCLGLR